MLEKNRNWYSEYFFKKLDLLFPYYKCMIKFFISLISNKFTSNKFKTNKLRYFLCSDVCKGKFRLVRYQNFLKTNISYPLIRVCACPGHGVENVNFSENLRTK